MTLLALLSDEQPLELTVVCAPERLAVLQKYHVAYHNHAAFCQGKNDQGSMKEQEEKDEWPSCPLWILKPPLLCPART